MNVFIEYGFQPKAVCFFQDKSRNYDNDTWSRLLKTKRNCLQICVVIDNVCSYEPYKAEHNRAKHTLHNTIILPTEQLHSGKRDGLTFLDKFRSSSLSERGFLSSPSERVSAGTDIHA